LRTKRRRACRYVRWGAGSCAGQRARLWRAGVRVRGGTCSVCTRTSRSMAPVTRRLLRAADGVSERTGGRGGGAGLRREGNRGQTCRWTGGGRRRRRCCGCARSRCRAPPFLPEGGGHLVWVGAGCVVEMRGKSKPTGGLRCAPRFTSQMMHLQSSETDARREPDSFHASRFTQPSCSSSTRSSCSRATREWCASSPVEYAICRTHPARRFSST
jgi:hypothetical protein